MKNFRLLLAGLMVAGFAFTSCGDDDSTPAAEQASITGKWFYSQDGFSAMGVDNLSNYDGHTAGCTKDNMELTEANAYKEFDYSGEACTESVVTSTYTRTPNSITFGTGENAEVYEIESITATTLRIRQLESTTGGQNVYWVETYTRN